MSLGGGRTWGSGTSQVRNYPDSDFTLSSGAFGFDIALGGSPADGVVIGGMFQFNLGNPSYSYDLAAQQNSQKHDQRSLGAIGPFVDWFPDPHGGGHIGALIGSASTIDYYDQNNQRTRSSGFAAGLFGGYDFWIGEQWSAGVLLRATYYGMTGSGDNDITEDLKLYNVALMGTLLFH